MSKLTTPEQEAAKLIFKKQYRYLTSGEAAVDGSVTIAAARAVAMALDSGLTNIAEAIESKYIPNIKGMPSLKEFHAGFVANKDSENLVRFKSGEPDPDHPLKTPGFNPKHLATLTSNAMGSYAFALDAAANGWAKAFENGGEAGPTANWAFHALKGAGFEKEATILKVAVISGIQLETVKTRSK